MWKASEAATAIATRAVFSLASGLELVLELEGVEGELLELAVALEDGGHARVGAVRRWLQQNRETRRGRRQGRRRRAAGRRGGSSATTALAAPTAGVLLGLAHLDHEGRLRREAGHRRYRRRRRRARSGGWRRRWDPRGGRGGENGRPRRESGGRCRCCW